MIRDSGKRLAQAVFLNAESEPLFQRSGSLLEDNYLEAVSHAADVRCWPVKAQRSLADNQDVVRRHLSVRINAFKTKA